MPVKVHTISRKLVSLSRPLDSSIQKQLGREDVVHGKLADVTEFDEPLLEG